MSELRSRSSPRCCAEVRLLPGATFVARSRLARGADEEPRHSDAQSDGQHGDSHFLAIPVQGEMEDGDTSRRTEARPRARPDGEHDRQRALRRPGYRPREQREHRDDADPGEGRPGEISGHPTRSPARARSGHALGACPRKAPWKRRRQTSETHRRQASEARRRQVTRKRTGQAEPAETLKPPPTSVVHESEVPRRRAEKREEGGQRREEERRSSAQRGARRMRRGLLERGSRASGRPFGETRRRRACPALGRPRRRGRCLHRLPKPQAVSCEGERAEQQPDRRAADEK